MSECVKVAVRCRPFNDDEKARNNVKCVKIVKENNQVAIFKPNDTKEEPKSFSFDNVWDDNSCQREVYDETMCELVDSTLEGYNATIFAYGQTGCGKTFTMQGYMEPQEMRGVIPNSFVHIFDAIHLDTTKEWLVRVAFLELYNEDVRDLLFTCSQDPAILKRDPNTKLEIRESPDRGIYIPDLTYKTVKDTDETLEYMEIGNKFRHVGATAMNLTSSRSHSIFICKIESSETDDSGDTKIKGGKLNLVDLAGSERQNKTHAEGVRLKEATKINLSLTCLGNVISSLVEGKGKHVPYRNSKLTRLLQDSLGGNTKTCMLAAIGPSLFNYEETLSTLRYANRAKNIKNKPVINEDPKDALLRQYKDEINKLKAMLTAVARGDSLNSLNFDDLGVENADGQARGTSTKGTKSVQQTPVLERRKTYRFSHYQGNITVQDREDDFEDFDDDDENQKDVQMTFDTDPNSVFSTLRLQAEAKENALQAQQMAQEANLKAQQQALMEMEAKAAREKAYAELVVKEAEAQQQIIRAQCLEAQATAQSAKASYKAIEKENRIKMEKMKQQNETIEKISKEKEQTEQEKEILMLNLREKEKTEAELAINYAKALSNAEKQAKKRTDVEIIASNLLCEHQKAQIDARKAQEEHEQVILELTKLAQEELKKRKDENEEKEKQAQLMEKRLYAEMGDLKSQKEMIFNEVKRISKEKAIQQKNAETKLAKEKEIKDRLKRKLELKEKIALEKKQIASQLGEMYEQKQVEAQTEKLKVEALMRALSEKQEEMKIKKEMLQNQNSETIENMENTRLHLEHKLKIMEEQLLHGQHTSQDHEKKKLEAKVRKQKRNLAHQKAIERNLRQEQDQYIEEKTQIQQSYSSLQEELEGNRMKIQKLGKLLARKKQELEETQEDFSNQRTQYLDDIRELEKENTLYKVISDRFIGQFVMQKIIENAFFNEEANIWELPQLFMPISLPKMDGMIVKSNRDRPQSGKDSIYSDSNNSRPNSNDSNHSRDHRDSLNINISTVNNLTTHNVGSRRRHSISLDDAPTLSVSIPNSSSNGYQPISPRTPRLSLSEQIKEKTIEEKEKEAELEVKKQIVQNHNRDRDKEKNNSEYVYSSLSSRTDKPPKPYPLQKSNSNHSLLDIKFLAPSYSPQLSPLSSKEHNSSKGTFNPLPSNQHNRSYSFSSSKNSPINTNPSQTKQFSKSKPPLSISTNKKAPHTFNLNNISPNPLSGSKSTSLVSALSSQSSSNLPTHLFNPNQTSALNSLPTMKSVYSSPMKDDSAIYSKTILPNF